MKQIRNTIRKSPFSEENVQKFNNLPWFDATLVYIAAKPLIWSEAEVDHVVMETSI